MAIVLHYSGYEYFSKSNWLRADSGHYLHIAKEGYEYFPCAGKFGFPEDSPFLCGNTGWFPGYPLLIRGIYSLFGSPILLAGLLSKLFFLGTLWWVSRLAELKSLNFKNLVLLSLAAFAFGNIYYHAIFPISAILFFALLGFNYALKEKFWISALAVAAISFLYPTGFLAAIVFSLYLLLKSGTKLKNKIKGSVIWLSAGALPVVAFFLYLHFEVGDWQAFIRVQEKYQHGWRNPLTSIRLMLDQMPVSGLTYRDIPDIQSVLVLGGYLLLSVYFFFAGQYRDKLKLLSYLYISAFLIFPWAIGGHLSMYRAESLLLPFVFLMKDLPLKLTLPALLVLIALSVEMAYLFFKAFLV